MKKIPLYTLGTLGLLLPNVYADQVIADDLIVQGSAAIGQDSVNGESFGFDTIRLKENNLRIKFQDTSNSGSFPSVDWQLTANDSTNGGLNKFSIDEIDSGRTPFTIESGAKSHSLYVDNGGRIGLGTSSPVVELHVVDGDSPTMRLEQDGSSGFTAQTWDVAGNETNFFVRDTTNGSKLPFKIRPSAPTNSLYVDTDGDVGLGTAIPSARLDVVGTAEINGETTIVGPSGASVSRTMLAVRNEGETSLQLENSTTTGTSSIWNSTVTNTGEYRITKAGEQAFYRFGGDGSFSIEIPGGFGNTVLMALDSGGNLITNGTVNGSSDVNRKKDFADVDTGDILEKVASIPVQTWQYKGEGITHMGPMAQDFYRAFELGMGERTISMADADGVALASIQALYEKVQLKEAEISNLKKSNDLLESRLDALEKMIRKNQNQ